jgi:cephalosporin-C deacetylase-like acetyl esterase
MGPSDLDAQKATLPEIERNNLFLETYGYDRALPLEASIVETEVTAKFTREKVRFQSGLDDDVAGQLFVPVSGKPPFPCVLWLHAGEGEKEWILGKDLAIVGYGVALLALDGQYHGERRKPGIDPRMRVLFEEELPYRA